jgi:hypothetical protein
MQRRQCIFLQIPPWFLPYLVLLTLFARTYIKHLLPQYVTYFLISLSIHKSLTIFVPHYIIRSKLFLYLIRFSELYIRSLRNTFYSFMHFFLYSIFLFKFYNRSHIPFDMEWILDGWFLYWIGWRCPFPPPFHYALLFINPVIDSTL